MIDYALRRPRWSGLACRTLLPLLLLIALAATAPAARDCVSAPQETAPTGLPQTIPVTIPVIRQPPRSGDLFSVQRTAAAIAVAGVFVALVFLLQRNVVSVGGSHRALLKRLFAKKSTASPLDRVDLIASRMVTAKHSVHVISWNGSRFLLGCDPNGMQVLDKAGCADAQTNGPD